MFIVLDNEQLHVAVRRLQGRQNSEYILGEISSKLDNILTDSDFIVDQWPEFTAMVRRVNPSCTKLRDFLDSLFCVYSEDVNRLMRLLDETGVLAKSSLTKLLFADEALKDGLINGLKHLHGGRYKINTYQVMSVTQEALELVSIPEGYNVGSLSKDQAPLVNSSWPFNHGTHSEAYAETLICKLPTCCLYGEEGHVVGFALQYHYGYVGMLYVIEKYRGKGYGKMIMSHLVETCLRKAKTIYVNVGVDNVASMRLHESIGFVKECLRYVLIFENGLSMKID